MDMKIEKLNQAKIPIVKIDKRLERFRGKVLFPEKLEKANEILGFRISDIMFSGSDEDLKQTNVTQPAVFLHSVIVSIAVTNNYLPV